MRYEKQLKYKQMKHPCQINSAHKEMIILDVPCGNKNKFKINT
jgi:hypothetical protein